MAPPVELQAKALGREAGMAKDFGSFGEFWPHYLREHSRPATRALHFVGTGLGLALLLAGILTGRAWLVPLALVSGYLFAWVGHLAVERNRPATFSHPLWSFAGDWRMFALFLAGRLGDELRRHGIARP